MTEPLDITICIPTFNRARELSETLRQVLDHPTIRFKKVMVSDNGSQDNTREVLETFKQRYDNFDYKVNDQNYGAMLNFHSLLSSSDTEFQYLLSDDDFLNHENIRTGVEFLTDNDFFSAFYGDYDTEVEFFGAHDFSQKNPKEVRHREYKTFNFSPEIIVFDTENLISHIKSAPFFHPIYRTRAYKQHCFLDEHAFGFWTTLARLLKFGPAIYYPLPLFTHQATEDRMERLIHTPWYFDQYVADFEHMVAELGTFRLNPDAGGVNIARMMVFHYEYALLDAVWRLQNPAKTRSYLARLRAYGQQNAAQLDDWNTSMLPLAVAQKVSELARLSGADTLWLAAEIPAVAEFAKLVGGYAGEERVRILDGLPQGAGGSGDYFVFADPAAADQARAAGLSNGRLSVYADWVRILHLG